jgi:hypothetical protein
VKKVFIRVRAGMAEQQATKLPELSESSKHELGRGTLEGVAAGKPAFETLSSEARKEFASPPRYLQVAAAGHRAGGEFLLELRERSHGA